MKMEHLFQPQVAEHDFVLTADNIQVECHYQGHPFYSLSKAICVALHLVFLKYCPTRSRVSASTLRRSIGQFFDFAQDYNLRNPEGLWITAITDLSAEVFQQFQNYLRENNQPIDNAARLKTALTNAASLTEAIPDLLLPYVTKSARQTRMPLRDDADEMLENALTSHADVLYDKLDFREKVHQAISYTFDEIYAKITYSRTTIFEWLQYLADNDKRIDWRSLLSKLVSSPDITLQKIALLPDWRRVIHSEYLQRGEEFRFESATNPFSGKRILNFKPDLARVLKTLLDNGYPFRLDLNDIGDRYATNKIFALEHCQDVIQLLQFRWRANHGAPDKRPLATWDDLLGMYYPTMMDMSCIIQFIMLQTNWNKEAVLALDPETFEHALTGAMNEDYVMLQTEKNKSQGFGKPFYAPKQIIAASTRSDKYSAYNLFNLAERLSHPLKEFEFDYVRHGNTASDYNSAFLCIRFYADWVSKGGRHTSSRNEKAFLQGIKQFLKKYPIYEEGNRLASAKDITMRLRPTWVKRRNKNGDISHGLLALYLGHASSVTTDVHYDNSPLAQERRYDRLESELESILQLMLSGKFEGMLGTPRQEAVQLPFKVFHIPGMEKPLWACSNQKQPTWQGAKQRVAPGERCYVVGRCVFCTQAFMFEDSLPYLMERRIHVVELIEDQTESSSEYSNDLEIELLKLDSILDNWEDESAIKEASRYQRRNTPLLPRDLNFLQVILEEEDRK